MALDNIPTLGPGGFNGNLDKVLVHKNGGSEVACSLLTLTNSALNPAGLYLDTVNQRVGIGTANPFSLLTVGGQSSFYSVQSAGVGADFFYSDINPNLTAGANSQVVSLLRLRDRGQTNTGGFTGTQRLSLIMENAAGGQFPFQLFSETGNLRIGFSSVATPTAMVEIKGTGSTFATNSLLVQNSSGANMFRVRDDGSVYCEGGGALSSVGIIGTVYGLFGGASYEASASLVCGGTTTGFLPPRMTTAQKNAIATPAIGLMIFDTDLGRPCFFNGTSWITL